MSEEKKAQSLVPLGDRIICKMLNDEKVIDGIVIPDMAQKKPNKAIVKAVGPGKMLNDGSLIPVNVEAGMKVLVQQYGGTDVEIEGEEYKIVQEHDILAVFGETEDE